MLATCWAQGAVGTPTIPARVMNRDTQALLDTGSVVTLLRPDLAGGKKGEPMEVACVHGDTRTYGTCHVVVRTPYSVFTPRAGIVPHLPVPLLIGRDCPIFHRLWNPERDTRAQKRASPTSWEDGPTGLRGHAAPSDSRGIDGRGPGDRGERTLTTGFPDPHGRADRPLRFPGTTTRHHGHPHGVRAGCPTRGTREFPPHRVLGFSSGRGGRNYSAGTVPQRSTPGRRPETCLEPHARP